MGAAGQVSILQAGGRRFKPEAVGLRVRGSKFGLWALEYGLELFFVFVNAPFFPLAVEV